MLTEFLKWVIGFICSGAASFFIGYYKYRKKRDKAVEEGLQALLRAEIIRQYEKHIDRGFCPVYAKEALKREYHSYHQLGGNDVATELYNQALKLPPEPPENNDKN